MKVLLTVPCEHWIHKHVVQRLLMLMQDGRYPVTLDFPSHKPYENNLHHIVQDFLAGDYTHWLNIDSDNPPMKNPLELVELDKDLIGLPTPIWHWTGASGERPIYWNAYDYDPKADAYREHPYKKGLQRVDAIGTGCFIAAKRIFENTDVMRNGPFTRILYPDGRVHKGNDLSFCERVRAAGFEIWAHYNYPCFHYSSNIEMSDVEQAIRGMVENV